MSQSFGKITNPPSHREYLMYKFTVEKPTLSELAAALLQAAVGLGAQAPSAAPLPQIAGDASSAEQQAAKPQRQRKEKTDPKPSAPAPSPAENEHVAGPAPGLALDSGELIPAAEMNAAKDEATPAKDSAPVVKLEDVRAFLSDLVKAGKQDSVNTLVQGYAPALSKVPADKLGELFEKAKQL